MILIIYSEIDNSSLYIPIEKLRYIHACTNYDDKWMLEFGMDNEETLLAVCKDEEQAKDVAPTIPVKIAAAFLLDDVPLVQVFIGKEK